MPTGIQVGAGVKAGSVYRITEQGSMTQTGNKLDLGIKGRGFLQVLLPSGETGYTRAGNLSLNADGVLCTADGYLVQPQITIPQDATDVTISATGQVQTTAAGQTAQTLGYGQSGGSPATREPVQGFAQQPQAGYQQQQGYPQQ